MLRAEHLELRDLADRVDKPSCWNPIPQGWVLGIFWVPLFWPFDFWSFALKGKKYMPRILIWVFLCGVFWSVQENFLQRREYGGFCPAFSSKPLQHRAISIPEKSMPWSLQSDRSRRWAPAPAECFPTVLTSRPVPVACRL